MFGRLAVLVVGLGLAVSPAFAQAPPEDSAAAVPQIQPQDKGAPSAPSGDLTKGEVMKGFGLDVARCLASRLVGGGVGDLPPGARVDLRPAKPEERTLFKESDGQVWTTDRLGPHVLLAERSPSDCQVRAINLPVEETFQFVISTLRKGDPALKDEPVKAGYWPIVHQLGLDTGGVHYTVNLSGSEPGGPEHPLRMLQGHAFRYSILIAQVTRTP